MSVSFLRLTFPGLGKAIMVSSLLVLVSACGSLTSQPDTPAGPDTANTIDCPPLDMQIDGMSIIGEVEWVSVSPEGIRQKARIDTGAQTSSIGAVNIQKFERDGQAWVAFTINDRETGKAVAMKRPIERVAKIKRHNTDAVERYVVKLKLTLGTIAETVDVSLADREGFEFPVLIGRNFLDGYAAVDVSKKFMALETSASVNSNRSQ